MSDLPKVVVKYDGEFASIDFSLYRNINILNDVSGKGKTNMVASITNALKEHEDIEIFGYYNGGKGEV